MECVLQRRKDFMLPEERKRDIRLTRQQYRMQVLNAVGEGGSRKLPEKVTSVLEAKYESGSW